MVQFPVPLVGTGVHVMADDFGGRTTRNICQDHIDDRCVPDAKGYCTCPLELAPADTAELVCSDLPGLFTSFHMPVIDLDLPCRLIESRTPGHHHLYIDRPMTFDQYMKILHAMAEAGIVEWGFHDATQRRGFGSVRHPDRLDGK